MNRLYLDAAIVAEVVATSALKAAEGLTRLIPSTVVVAGYVVAFCFLSLSLRTIPVGIAYAIWSGIGIYLFAPLRRLILFRFHSSSPFEPLCQPNQGRVLGGF